MLTVQKTGDNRIDLTLDGKLDDAEMMAGLEALLANLEGVKNGVMLYRIDNFTMPSFGALTAELMSLPSIWRMLGRIDRCAVISEVGWIRMGPEIEGAVIPGLTIKAFSSNDEAAAEAWLGGPAYS